MSPSRSLRPARLAVSIATVLLAGAALPLAAQDSGSAPKVKALEAIKVTAEKREENLQDVPVSISVIQPEQLRSLTEAGDGVLALSGRAPSVYAETSYGREFPRFYIRGLGNSDFDLNASQPVSMVYDDIVQENPILKGFPLFDLQQVEVLRGPQGTQFGRNSPAGVIKFDSVKPSQETSGYASLSYGSYGTANAEAALGGALSSSWSARVSALAQHRDAWINNDFKGKRDDLGQYNDRAVRLQALYQPGSEFSALINVHARWLDGSAMVNRANAIAPGGDSLAPGFDRDTVYQDGNNTQHLFTWGSNLHLVWNLGELTFTSITGLERATTYSLGDVDGGYGAVFHPPSGPGLIPFASETADALPKDRQITQEFRLANDQSNQLKWQTGLYYFNEDVAINNFSYDTFDNHLLNDWARQSQSTKAWAAFGSLDYALTDRFDVRAGARWSHDRRDFSASRLFGYTGPIGPLKSSPTDARWSGDLTGTFKVDDNLNLYGRIANGFRAPSVQGRITFGDTISTAKPETITSFELGLKSLAAQGRLRFNADIYKYTMHNQQLTAVGGASNVTQLLNAKKTEGYGAEFDLEAYLTPNFITTLGGSYNHTELKDRNLSVAPCGAPSYNCTVLDPLLPNGNALINGNSLPNAPKWIGTWTARYGIPYGESGEFFVYTDWSYRSEVNFFLYDSAEYRSKPLLLGGLRVGYNWDLGKREIALYGRNITNKKSITGAIDFNNRTAFINDPRVVGVEFRAEL